MHQPLPSTLLSLLQDQHFAELQSVHNLGGGCINEVSRLLFADGNSAVLKLNSNAPADFFTAEASGLAQLSAGKLRIPQVIAVAQGFIVLEDLGDAQPSGDFWQLLGRRLAELHSLQGPYFGASSPNYCGATRQSNTPTDSGHEFFAQQRLLALGRPARDRGQLNDAQLAQLEFIANSLERWIPSMPAVVVHGDLWSGNVHCCANGSPALIDPAAYWGWAESDLAMTLLFGGFPESFYQGYAESGALLGDWRERAPLYNLYHLLNHLLLFGDSYLPQVRDVLRRFS